MHLPTSTALAAFVLPFLGTGATAQTLPERAPQIDAVGATRVARAAAYEATFAHDGVTFRSTPRDGGDATMRWTATAVGRGEPTLALAPPEPTHEARQVRHDRGACVERYDVLEGGIEQSFVFASLPAGSTVGTVRRWLTTSTTPGHAMRAQNPRPGTIVGKALESLGSGTARIKVLVMLQ